VPDADLGERVEAFVVPGSGADWPALEAALRARAEAGLPRYARPRAYRRVGRLPRNTLGKLLRGQLSLAPAQDTGESPPRAANRQRNPPPAASRTANLSS
jgi:acyl-CoA synthetase (AMP-forming)/AMP-acid ligase II